MRLTQIKLAGFKSFVDPTSIVVPGQLVGIVGPNGCGKSNVIDAVRWVLGESRASALRGDSMQDVIFNGSSQRQPLARASVELVFDNSLGRAAGQWSQYAEISVKRVLQRDGESAYYINNQHVRRRDITDIFLGTGLGPRAYAIIEQGMISRVIEAKPDDLRIFLEEAAGISKYKERRKETASRLTETRDNLSRVNDIRLELGNQIEKLESQAEVANRYNSVRRELQDRQHLLWFVRRRDAALERDRQAAELTRLQNGIDAETAALRSLESRVEVARSTHYAAGDQLNAAQAALYGANAEVARLESELRHAEEQRHRLESQYTERRTQLASWREQRSQLTQALHMWAARSEEAKRSVASASTNVSEQEAQLPEAERAYRATQDQLQEARGEVMRAESALELLKSGFSHAERSLATLEQRRTRLESERESLVAPDESALRSLAQRIADEQTSIERARLEAEAAQTAHEQTQQALDEQSDALEKCVQEETAAQSKLATLRQIQAATEDNAPLHDWLGRHGLTHLTRLWQKLRIEPGWETALEAVLRERLHAIELDTRDALVALVADAPPVKASSYVKGGAEARRSPDGTLVPLLSKVQTTDPELDNALADWLSRVYCIEGVPDTSALDRLDSGALLVNPQGHQFTRFTLTLHAPDPVDAGLLARQAEIETLEPRCAELASAADRQRDAVSRLEGELDVQRGLLDGAREALEARQQELHDAQIEQVMLQQRHQRYIERVAQIEAELSDIVRDGAHERSLLDASRDAQASAETEIRSVRARLESVREQHVQAEVALAERRRAIQEAERRQQDAIFGARECESKIGEIDRSVKIIDQQIARAEQETESLSSELSEDPIPPVRQALEAAVSARMGCESTLAEARDGVEQAAAELRSLEEQRLEVDRRIAPMRDQVGEARLKEQAARLSFEQFAQQLQEAQANEDQLTEIAQTAPRPSTLQGEITRLSQELEGLGAVNLAAVDELTSSQERKQYLDAQSTDLEEAVQTLEEAIRRIDRETRELLRETFDSVNRHFATLFPALFGGGEAKLLMTGEEILDAGVQVMAQPPGKRNTSIHLLSGGEKALTAIALVFAMFQLNPAPFCLLDEVDAPLDDSNAVRFGDLVKRMSSQTQFLFISHNKITIEIAQQLVGVTMPESGVSRVVAVDVDEALRMREDLAA